MPTNLQIKFIKSLQLKKNRQEYRQFVCEGRKIVEELIAYRNVYIESIYATEEMIKQHDIHHPKLEIVNSSDMERMTGLKTSPQILALVRYFEIDTCYQPQPISLYLDDISDPGNLGTILRTAEWYGLHTVYASPNTVDIYNPKVIQSSMGSCFRVRLIPIAISELSQSISFSSIIATTLDGVPMEQYLPMNNSLVIIGNESQGISSSTMQYATDCITIPNRGRGESLNASIATAIILNQYVK